MPLKQHQTLVRNLVDRLDGGAGHHRCELIETHISSVILCGDTVYKIKKPVDFGFLDFTRLDDRSHFCREEVRLNRRLAPDIYLDSVPITGTLAQPGIGGDGPVLDYAVKMKRFDETAQLDHLLQQGQLDEALIQSLAQRMAAFHDSIEQAAASSDHGHPAQILAPMLENVSQIQQSPLGAMAEQRLRTLEQWTRERFRQLQGLLSERQANGFIRECHGDMHLGNMAKRGDEVLIFDGIEFNENLRWIDVFSELAFTTMDLAANARPVLAGQLLNQYLELSGDYDGLPLLDFYQVYRAMVRAKVAALSPRPSVQTLDKYLDLALHFTRPATPRLLLVGGYSATGKSTLSGHLLGDTRSVRLRSDRERKRLFADQVGMTGQVNAGLYSPGISAQTYAYLLRLAQQLLQHGLNVIIDATFLKRAQREPFQALAQTLSVPCQLLWLDAPAELLVQRMTQRLQLRHNISDANEDVIHHQKANAEVPGQDEAVIAIDASVEFDIARILRMTGLNGENRHP